MSRDKKLKVAIVYDWIDSWGGVERLLLMIRELFPSAVYFTSYADIKKATWAQDMRVKTSFMQDLPGFIKTNRVLSIPLYPYAFESFDLRDYDVVLSITSSFAKGVITRPETLHISYILSPTRFLWSHTDVYVQSQIKRLFVAPWLESLRSWDYVAAQRPDIMLSLSKTVQARCKKYYGRDSEVVYPPFDSDYWQRMKTHIEAHDKNQIRSVPKPYYLAVARLEQYKRVDLLIDVFNKRPKDTLVIVGQGRQERFLRALAGPNIHFRPNVIDTELASLYSNAEAFLMPQEEDFGYVALEAQFFGCPVISYKQGGGGELVEEGVTGIFFQEQSEKALESALEKYHTISYNIRSSTHIEGPAKARRFRKQNFFHSIQKHIDTQIERRGHLAIY